MKTDLKLQKRIQKLWISCQGHKITREVFVIKLPLTAIIGETNIITVEVDKKVMVQ